MSRFKFIFLFLPLLVSCSFKKPEGSSQERNIERLIRILSADEMQGRAAFTPEIDRAAEFIEEEFRLIGLQPIEGKRQFLQQFPITHIKPGGLSVIIDNKTVSNQAVIVITDLQKAKVNHKSGMKIISIRPGKDFLKQYQEIIKSDKNVLVLVDKSYTDTFEELRYESIIPRNIEPGSEKLRVIVFVLGIIKPQSFKIDFNNQIKKFLLSNVVGVIPGKSRAKESVIFSAHYDHIGIIKPNSIKEFLRTRLFKSLSVDSVANGADDNASGVAGVISLANYFKNLENNERTLIFVAFAAEELGFFGSRHFIKMLNPSNVVAMFNIEMIGKQSKFGKNTAFITGYDKTNLGQILQRNLIGTKFKLHPDPYPEQNLFYRSDNVSLAVLGIPAHTISTDQIDTDKFFHTIDDEYETLDIANVSATIEAVALGSTSIVTGKDTPERISLYP